VPERLVDLDMFLEIGIDDGGEDGLNDGWIRMLKAMRITLLFGGTSTSGVADTMEAMVAHFHSSLAEILSGPMVAAHLLREIHAGQDLQFRS